MVSLHQSFYLRTSSLCYFSFGMHSEYSGIKTTWELAMHALPSLKFCRCAAKKGVLAQDQLDGYEDVKEVVHQQGIMIKTLWHWKNLRTCCQEILWRLAIVSNTYSLLEEHQLRFDSRHCRLAYKNDILQFEDNNWCTSASLIRLSITETQLSPSSSNA